MHRVFGLNYFVFCFIVLTLVLFFTKEMRDEGFFGTTKGVTNLLRSTSIPTLEGEGFFGMSPGTLVQLQSTDAPSCSLPPMSTSMMNPMSTPLNSLIQGNLTKKGLLDMTEESDTNPGFYALI